jgi:TRAP-type C4-dicarboxylate transport system substrate-binding protein
MGGSPTPMPPAEVYTALQTGVVDGQENPASDIWQRKLNEVQKYINLTGHITQNQVVVINEDTYQALKPDHQKILQQAAMEAGDYQNGLVEKANADALVSLRQAGMNVVEADVPAFREATKDACRDPALEKKWGVGFFDKLHATQK